MSSLAPRLTKEDVTIGERVSGPQTRSSSKGKKMKSEKSEEKEKEKTEGKEMKQGKEKTPTRTCVESGAPRKGDIGTRCRWGKVESWRPNGACPKTV